MEKKVNSKLAVVPTPHMHKVIKYVSVKLLKVAFFNPPARSTPKAIAMLLAEISIHGILNPLHAIMNGMLADGHRRLACAVALGMETVPVIYHEGEEKDLPRLWAYLNKDTRKIDGSDWLYWWFNMKPSCDLKSKLLPPLVLRKIKDCWEVFGGEEGVIALIQANYSPFAGQRAKEALRFVNSFESLSGELTPRMVGDWILRQGKPSLAGLDFAYRAGLASGGRGGLGFARRIVGAIKNDKSLTENDLRLRLASKNAGRSRKDLKVVA